MCKTKFVFILAILIIPMTNYGQYTDQINSNRPGETMSAYAVGKSVIQIESGIYGIRENHNIINYEANGFGIDMTVRWGLFMEKLEFIADFQYQYQFLNPAFVFPEKSAFKQAVFGAKYLIYDPFKNYQKKVNIYSWKANRAFNWRQFIPAVSVFAGSNLTSSDNPYYYSSNAGISPKLMLITQNHLGDGSWVFVTNIITDYIATDNPSYGYVITLTKGINQKWSAFAENQGFKSNLYSDAIVRGGAAYLLHDDLQVDASLSTNLKNTPSILYGGIGFSWRYDAKYKMQKLDKYKKTTSESTTNKKKKKRKKINND